MTPKPVTEERVRIIEVVIIGVIIEIITEVKAVTSIMEAIIRPRVAERLTATEEIQNHIVDFQSLRA